MNFCKDGLNTRSAGQNDPALPHYPGMDHPASWIHSLVRNYKVNLKPAITIVNGHGAAVLLSCILDGLDTEAMIGSVPFGGYGYAMLKLKDLLTIVPTLNQQEIIFGVHSQVDKPFFFVINR